MFNIFDSDNSDTDTVYKDAFTLILLGIVVLFIIVLAHVNPVGDENNAEIDQPGNLSIDLTWPLQQNTDLDLWILPPDGNVVGYSNKDTPMFNLLRDDLGGDPNNIHNTMNYEIAFARAVIPGEYVVNVHVYNSYSELPVTATVTVKLRIPGSDNKVDTFLTKEIILTAKGEELTVFRFTVNEDGLIDLDTVTDLPKKVRRTQ